MLRILVTGANRGLGLEFARQYIARGDRVWACCRRPQAAAELGELAGANRDRLVVVPLDVASVESIHAARDVVGGQTAALDLLVNNAGVYNAKDEVSRETEALGSLTFDDALKIFRINSIGPLMVAQRFFDLLKAGDASKIVSVSSGYGSVSENTGGFPYHYCASKAALNMYMRSLAGDAKPAGVICTLLNPGWVRTDMGGANATLSPEESVGGMIRVIDDLTMDDAGGFLNHDGRNQAW